MSATTITKEHLMSLLKSQQQELRDTKSKLEEVTKLKNQLEMDVLQNVMMGSSASEEVERLKNELKIKSTEISQIEIRENNARKEIVNQRNEIQNLNARLQAVTEKNGTLKDHPSIEEFNRTKKALDDALTRERTQSQVINELKIKHSTIGADFEKLQSTSSRERTEFQEAIKKLEDENTDLKLKTSGIQEDELHEMKNEMARLGTANAAFEQQVEKQNGELQSLRKLLEDSKRVEKLHEETIRESQNKVDATTQELRDANFEITGLKETLDAESNASQAALEALRKKLENERETAKAKFAELQEKFKPMESLPRDEDVARISNLQQETESLRTQLKEAQESLEVANEGLDEANKEIVRQDELLRTVQSKDAEIAQLQNQVNSNVHELEESQRKLEEAHHETRTKVSEVEQMKIELGELQQRLDEAHRSGNQAYDDLKHENEIQKTSMEDLLRLIAESENEQHALKDFSKKQEALVASLREELTNLQASLEERASVSQAEFENLQSTSTRLQEECQELSMLLSAKQDALDTANVQLEEKSKEIASVLQARETEEETSRKMENLTREYEENMQIQEVQFNEVIRSLAESKEEADSRNSHLGEELQIRSLRIRELEEEISTMLQTEEVNSKEIARLNELIEGFNEKRQTQEHQMTEEIQSLAQSKNVAESRCSVLTEEAQIQSKRVSELEAEITILRQAQQADEDSTKEMERVTREYQDNLHIQENQLNEIIQSLKQSKEDAESRYSSTVEELESRSKRVGELEAALEKEEENTKQAESLIAEYKQNMLLQEAQVKELTQSLTEFKIEADSKSTHLNDELNSRSIRVTELEVEIAGLTQVKNQLDESIRTCEDLRESVATLEKSSMAKDEKLKVMHDQMAHEIEERDRELAAKSSMMSTLQEEVKRLEIMMDDTRRSLIQDKETLVTTLRKNNDALQLRFDDLTNTYEISKAAESKYEYELSEFQRISSENNKQKEAMIETLRDDNEKLKSQVDTMADKCKNSEDTQLKLKVEIEAGKERLKTLQAKLDQIQDQESSHMMHSDRWEVVNLDAFPAPPVSIDNEVVQHTLRFWSSDPRKRQFMNNWFKHVIEGKPLNQENFPCRMELDTMCVEAYEGFCKLIIPILRDSRPNTTIHVQSRPQTTWDLRMRLEENHD